MWQIDNDIAHSINYQWTIPGRIREYQHMYNGETQTVCQQEYRLPDVKMALTQYYQQRKPPYLYASLLEEYNKISWPYLNHCKKIWEAADAADNTWLTSSNISTAPQNLQIFGLDPTWKVNPSAPPGFGSIYGYKEEGEEVGWAELCFLDNLHALQRIWGSGKPVRSMKFDYEGKLIGETFCYEMPEGSCPSGLDGGFGYATQEQPTQEQPTQEQPTQEQPTQEQPTQEQPTQEQPAQEQPTQYINPAWALEPNYDTCHNFFLWMQEVGLAPGPGMGVFGLQPRPRQAHSFLFRR